MNNIKVLNIAPTELIHTGKADDLRWQNACDSWQLSPQQIELFFTLSKEYSEEEYDKYLTSVDWGHCSINGSIQSGNRYWNFEINSSGVAEWYSDDRMRMWVCNNPSCKTLLIQEKDKPIPLPKKAVKVTKILPTIYEPLYDSGLDEQAQQAEEKACLSWRLTSAQIEEFYQLSDEYLDGYGEATRWLPCKIYGTLEYDKQEWQFVINQSAASFWRNGDKIKFWQCYAKKCRTLNMLPPDTLSN